MKARSARRERDVAREARPHPWHGLDPGPDAPRIVDAFIEMTPFDLVKYEVEKLSGYVRVDRPQRFSSQSPTLYGFIPRTYCGDLVGRMVAPGTRGDGDPLDICVVTERPITRAEILIRSRVIGGLQMIDNGEADDKIIAVLWNDDVWGHVRDVSRLPPVMVERLQHYFATYKSLPGRPSRVKLTKVYGRSHAIKVVQAALADYRARFDRSPAS